MEPIDITDGEPTAVYRLYDKTDALLYVGITRDLRMRFAQHEADKPWWPDVARKTMAWHGKRSDALAEEDRAIDEEHPVHNVAGIAPSVRLANPDDIPELWVGDGDVIAQVERVATSKCRNHALVVLLMIALLEGCRELPTGQELEDLAAKVHISRATAYRLQQLIRAPSKARRRKAA